MVATQSIDPASRTPTRSARSRWILLVVLLAGWSLRVYHLNFYDLRGDEVFGIGFSAQPLGQLFQALAHGEPHPPLFYLLLRYWTPIASDNPVALRWIAAAAGTLGIAMLATVGRRIGGTAVGLIAAIFATISPYYIWNSQDARMYALATFFSTAAVYWSWRLLTDERNPLRSAGLTTLFLTLALYAHYYSIYVALLLNLFAVSLLMASAVRGAPGKAFALLKWWAGSQLVSLALFLPWALYAIDTLTTYHGSALSPTIPQAIHDTLSTFAFGWDIQQNIADRLLPIFIVGLVIGVVAVIWRQRKQPVLLLMVLWLVFPVAAIWLSSRTRPIFDARYIIEASPPFYLFLAFAVRWLAQFGAWQRLAAGAMAVVFVVPFVLGVNAVYFTPSDGRGHTYTALAAFFTANVKPSDLLIANHLDPVVRYYAQHAGVDAPYIVEPSRQGLTPEELNAELTRAIRGHNHVWLMQDDVGAWDVKHTVTAWFTRHTELVHHYAQGYDVYEFRPIAPAVPLNVQFGTAVQLAGTTLTSTTLRPGETLGVTLFWRAIAPMATKETVSVQVLAADGKLVAQADAPPQAGAAPTDTWQPFELLPDLHQIALPSTLANGRYSVGVAMYPSGGGPRLSVAGVASALVPIGEIEVHP